jgi:MoaA/NifB/PqqE/SkfB family radical SAM enzyme
MPFCYSPWTNIDISPLGDISPCCKFQTKYYDQKFNLQESSISIYANSEFLKNIKQEFSDNQWPRGCERCRIEEENGIESKRMLDHDRWKEHYQDYELKEENFITASLAFGNTCNLKCITCNPYSSSQWRKEYQDIYQVDIQPFKFYKQNFVTDFVKSAPDIIHLDIPGGEPFLSGIKEQKQLLQHYIDQNQAKDITLHYTTNVTVFPDTEWWNIWKSFKEIDLQLSLDGIGEQYEYIRYPAVWSEVLPNIKKYIAAEKTLDNFRISVSHTVSAYNIYYLDKFVSWCHNMGLPRPWMGRVHNPDYMRPTVWPELVRRKIVEQLSKSQHTEVNDWATLMSNEDDSMLFETFKSRLHQHDQYRNLRFGSTFPELSKYL